ncbi:unnamed protein product [Menidia menidia]|uniref:(Atlantic silverside) hypothetical protein n=1 Tax=Menidia menidia TaxID=238744 RepID=A0A8S4BXR0_9TELE|nr:unnamed protein product [Menidia menidia]
MLAYETVRIELVQMMPPVGDTLACFEEDAQSFLFPEPKLVRPFSGVDREVLMSRAPHFLGIAPRLEFTTKTTITECSPDAEVKVYPNKPMKPFGKQSTRRSSKPGTRCPPIRGGERGDRADRGRESIVWPLPHQPRSLSLSPLRDRNPQHPARLSSDSVERDTGISRAFSAGLSGLRRPQGRSLLKQWGEHQVAEFLAWNQTVCMVDQLLFSSDQAFQHRQIFPNQKKLIFQWFGNNFISRFSLKKKVVAHVLAKYLKMIPCLWKHTSSLPVIVVLALQNYSGPIEKGPLTSGESAVLTERGRRSMIEFGDSSLLLKLCADFLTEPQSLRWTPSWPGGPFLQVLLADLACIVCNLCS